MQFFFKYPLNQNITVKINWAVLLSLEGITTFYMADEEMRQPPPSDYKS
ncbi:MAG: hypothetical protein AAF990_11005 [Bacteroidota bacterium]